MGSRRQADQEQLIRSLSTILEWVNDRVPAEQPLALTIGDEFQGAYTHLADALGAALLVRLKGSTSLDLRFGLGEGEIVSLDSSRAPLAQSGSAWWRAREAISTVERRSSRRRRPRSQRTMYVGSDSLDSGQINAFLLCRDSLLAAMDDIDLRLTLGAYLGEQGNQIARELGISQSAVSQRQQRNGAYAVVRAHQALEESVR